MADDQVGLSLRDEQRQVTRARLIRAGAEVFQRRGYSATSTQDIVDEAGVSRGTFYLHFKSKAEVLVEVFLAMHQDPVTEMLDALDPDGNDLTVAHLGAWLAEYMSFYESTRLVMRAWIQGEGKEGAKLGPKHTELLHAWIERMAAVVRRIRQAQGIKESVKGSELRALIMFSELERFCYYAFIKGLEVDRDSARRIIARSWHRLLTDPT